MGESADMVAGLWELVSDSGEGSDGKVGSSEGRSPQQAPLREWNGAVQGADVPSPKYGLSGPTGVERLLAGVGPGHAMAPSPFL